MIFYPDRKNVHKEGRNFSRVGNLMGNHRANLMGCMEFRERRSPPYLLDTTGFFYGAEAGIINLFNVYNKLLISI
jgi:hypothetical protein